jgi:phosphoglycerate dehydrogenase-like enzyme
MGSPDPVLCGASASLRLCGDAPEWKEADRSLTIMKILSTLELDEPAREQIARAGGPGVALFCSRDTSAQTAAAGDAEVIYGWVTPALLAAATQLKWAHITSAGVERALFPEMVRHPAVMTNARGVAAVSIAEHAFALILAFTRGLPLALRNQQERRWAHTSLIEICGQTLGIVGLGRVGREVAQRAAGFGMRVLAVDVNPVDPPGSVTSLWPPDRLLDLCAAADILVNCSPLTPQTERMIGREQFARMKPSALFVNVSRGRVVDQEALVEALRSGRIAGAALDVVDPEPLPADSPLWEMPNVILTAHSATTSQHFWRRMHELFCENLRRYVASQPLLNVVDKTAGF